MDWQDTANNYLHLVNQSSLIGALYTCRPDLIGVVNPDRTGLGLIELNSPGVPVRTVLQWLNPSAPTAQLHPSLG